MTKPIPLSALSVRNVVTTNPLQFGPNHPEVVGQHEIGGPQDPADRRLVLDAATLRHLLEIANTSMTQRVVLHHLGLKVQVLRDRKTGHTWEHLTLIGSEPKPETSLLFGGE